MECVYQSSCLLAVKRLRVRDLYFTSRAPPMPGCAADTFDASGTWVSGPPSKMQALWECPIREWNLPQVHFVSRSSCRTTRNPHPDLWRDYTVDGCPRISTYDVAVPDRTIFFAGDSMAHQHWHAFACRQLYEGMSRMGCNETACRDRHARPYGQPPSKNTPHIRCDKCRGFGVRYPVPMSSLIKHRAAAYAATRSPPDSAFDCVEFTLGDTHQHSFRTCFMQTNLTTIRWLHRTGAARQGDALVVNSGLTERAHDLTATLQPLARALSSLSKEGVRVLWRETHPQHFPPVPTNLRKLDNSTTDFFIFRSGQGTGATSMYHKQMHTAYRKHGRCEPMVSLERTPLSSRDLALFRDAGLPIILIWGLTSTQWDVHREIFAPHPYTISALDCTHFCTPSGVMEAWVDATTNALANRWGFVHAHGHGDRSTSGMTLRSFRNKWP